MENPHDPRKEHAAYCKFEREAATMEGALQFCVIIARLEAEGKKATFANLNGGIRAEAERQIARKKGWAVTGVSVGKRGVGWLLTDLGRKVISEQTVTS